ncbi:MAG: hypothetical protein EKK31_15035 [Hyphomicrobiales bacterium]|nr:MAG: hypothetical protein EKK31_15035 [Hyphomicrobiales bacterium]
MSGILEVGKDYLVTLVGNAPEDHCRERDAIWRGAEVDFPLVRFRRADRNDWIVNVTSSHFVSAQIANPPVDDEGNEIGAIPGEV